jgi:hypothetical protein
VTLAAPVNTTPLQANRHPWSQKRRRSSGIPIRWLPCLYLARIQRISRFHAWLSTSLNTALDTPWVFGDRDTGIYLFKFGWTRIERHVCVAGANSRDDPRLADYWAARARRKMPATTDRATIALAARQKGVCVLCKQPLIFGADFEPDNVREWAAWFSALMKRLHKHHFVYRRDGGSDDWATCASSTQAATGSTTPPTAPATGRSLQPARPSGPLEPRCGESPHARF